MSFGVRSDEFGATEQKGSRGQGSQGSREILRNFFILEPSNPGILEPF